MVAFKAPLGAINLSVLALVALAWVGMALLNPRTHQDLPVLGDRGKEETTETFSQLLSSHYACHLKQIQYSLCFFALNMVNTFELPALTLAGLLACRPLAPSHCV